MPAPTAPEVTNTTALPAFFSATTWATNCSNCAGSISFRLSVRTPVPSLTTRRETDLSESRCTREVKKKWILCRAGEDSVERFNAKAQRLGGAKKFLEKINR